MKYFKILEISYSDNLNTQYCKEIAKEDIRNSDGTVKIFTKYRRIGNIYGEKMMEEKIENLDNKTTREITEEEWKEQLEYKKADLERKIERSKDEIRGYERFKGDIDEELAELEKAEA